MSYILEALRKAQAERERGQVPGLDARTLADAPLPQPAGQAPLVRWVAGGVGLGLVALIGLGLWRWLAAPEAPAATPTVASRVAPQPVAVPVPVPAPSPTAMTSAPPAPVPVPAATPQPLPVVVSAPVAPTPAPRVAQAPASATVAASAAAAAIRDIKLAQVPPELRRELPPLKVGGSMWSESSGSRFVIVDGQVLREGEAAAGGVTVERISQKAAWLRWRDWRIELPL